MKHDEFHGLKMAAGRGIVQWRRSSPRSNCECRYTGSSADEPVETSRVTVTSQNVSHRRPSAVSAQRRSNVRQSPLKLRTGSERRRTHGLVRGPRSAMT